MNPRQLATVAFAIVGIVVILFGLPDVIPRMMELDWSRVGSFAPIVILIITADLLIAAALLFRGERLAQRLFPATKLPIIQIRAQDLLSVALVLLGIVLVTLGVTKLLGEDYVSWHRQQTTPKELNWQGLAHVFWFTVGIALILAPRVVARVLMRGAFDDDNAALEGSGAKR